MAKTKKYKLHVRTLPSVMQAMNVGAMEIARGAKLSREIVTQIIAQRKPLLVAHERALLDALWGLGMVSEFCVELVSDNTSQRPSEVRGRNVLQILHHLEPAEVEALTGIDVDRLQKLMVGGGSVRATWTEAFLLAELAEQLGLTLLPTDFGQLQNDESREKAKQILVQRFSADGLDPIEIERVMSDLGIDTAMSTISREVSR